MSTASVGASIDRTPLVPDMGYRSRVYALYCVGVALANAQVVRALIEYANKDRSASHLVAIPFLSAALIWLRRRDIFSSVEFAWRTGAALIGGGILLTTLVRVLEPDSGRPEVLGLLVIAALVQWVGGFLLVFGWNAVWASRFAISLLAFAIPMPQALVDGATGLLQHGSVRMVAALFTLTGTPYDQQGFVFALPTVSVEVADACSGIRSSIALMLTALVAGHLYLRSGWKQAVLAGAVLPLTMVKNGVRIATLSLLAIHVDPAFLTGPLHKEGGVLFFLLSLGLLLPLFIVLHRPGARAHREDVSRASRPLS